jgi:hypothetical protein
VDNRSRSQFYLILAVWWCLIFKLVDEEHDSSLPAFTLRLKLDEKPDSAAMNGRRTLQEFVVYLSLEDQ